MTNLDVVAIRLDPLFCPTFPISPAGCFWARRRFGLRSSSRFLALPSMAVLLLLLPPLLWLLQQRRGNGFILKTDALFLCGPPLQKLGLSLQICFLCLYVPQRAALLLPHIMRPALQLLDLSEGDLHAGG